MSRMFIIAETIENSLKNKKITTYWKTK